MTVGTGMAMDTVTVGTGVALDTVTVGTGVALDTVTVATGVALDTVTVATGVALDTVTVGTGVAMDTVVAAPPVTLADWELRGRAVTAPEIRDFVAGGSGDETALRANRTGLDAIRVVPRMLGGVAAESAAGRLLNSVTAMPVAVAPMAYQQLLHPGGETAAAAAAVSAGIPFTIGTLSSHAMEDVARTGADLWFQLYWLDDDRAVEKLVRRAEYAGCSAIMVTADMPMMARRLRDIRNEFTLPDGVRAVHLASGGSAAATDLAHLRISGSAVAAHTADILHGPVGRRQLELLRRWTDLPIAVKGILHPDDAVRAMEFGADAVVVSNHGGRQFDGAPAAISQLAAVAKAVGKRCTVLFDSGIRSGLDVVRALALGADGVLIGRPVLWGLAAAGREGVAEVLSLLHAELLEALTLAGCGSPTEAAALTTVVAP